MRQKLNSAQFLSDQDKFQFRFCCEDCSFFMPENETCIHFWPVKDHRRSRYANKMNAPSESDLINTIEVIYCKEFELR